MIIFQSVEQIGGQWLQKRKDYLIKKRLQKEGIMKNEEFLNLIRMAKEELKTARDNFNYAVDSELLEYYIYEIKAAETKLNYYLGIAKKENLKNDNYMADLFYDLMPKGSVSV